MIYVSYIILFLIFLSLYRLIAGPTFFDRLVSFSIISVLVILLMCCLAVVFGEGYYMDIAILYSLLSFSGIIAFSKFFQEEGK
ncbi:MAG: monovalent cation/H+ antiporter complex subunit F [Candidatus Muiribacteriota bacterium]